MDAPACCFGKSCGLNEGGLDPRFLGLGFLKAAHDSIELLTISR